MGHPHRYHESVSRVPTERAVLRPGKREVFGRRKETQRLGSRSQDLVRKWPKRSVWLPLPASIHVLEQGITLQSSVGHPMSTSHHLASHCGMSKKGCVDSPHSWGLSEDKQVHVSSPYSDYPCHSLNGGFPTQFIVLPILSRQRCSQTITMLG